MIECEQFPAGSRQRQICEGKSDLSVDKVNSFRKLHGLESMEDKLFVCECENSGLCPIHNIIKSEREFQICKNSPGVDSHTRSKYLNKWKENLINPTTKPKITISRPQVIRGVGDIAASAIKVMTLGLVKPCAPCSQRQASLNQMIPINKYPALCTDSLDNPVRHLLFNVYPLTETRWVWQRNLDRICKNIGQFNGQKVIAVLVNPDTNIVRQPGRIKQGPTDPPEMVMKYFDDRGITNIKFIISIKGRDRVIVQ